MINIELNAEQVLLIIAGVTVYFILSFIIHKEYKNI